MENKPQFLFVNIRDLGSQNDLNTILKTDRLRDQTSKLYAKVAPGFSINYIVGDMVAKFFNLTLITNGHAAIRNSSEIPGKCGKLTMTTFPQLISPVSIFGGLARSLNLWNCFYNQSRRISNTTENPAFVKKESAIYNFAYCSSPTKTFESMWNFKMLTEPFDIWTWLVLSVLLIFVSILVSVSTSHNFFIAFLSAFAALLDNEMRHFTNSKLYILWLFTSLIIVDFYAGVITSRVIAPPEETHLETLSDLEQNNFTIIFPHNIPANAINTSVREMNKLGNASENLRILAAMLKRSEVVPFHGEDSFFNRLIDNSRVATLAGAAFVLWYASKANMLISKRNLIKNPSKTCDVCKEMINIVGERFLALTPPGSAKMASIFQRLIATGIIPRWDQETVWLMYAERVQDRSRIVSRTKIAKEEAAVQPLRMDGKIVTIFVFYVLCVIGCCVSLSYELLIYNWSNYNFDFHFLNINQSILNECYPRYFKIWVFFTRISILRRYSL